MELKIQSKYLKAKRRVLFSIASHFLIHITFNHSQYILVSFTTSKAELNIFSKYFTHDCNF